MQIEGETYIELKNKILNLRSKIPNKKTSLKYDWFQLLREIGYLITDNITLSSYLITNNNLIIKGKTIEDKSVIKFIENLNKSRMYFQCKIFSMKKNKNGEILFKIKGKIY